MTRLAIFGILLVVAGTGTAQAAPILCTGAISVSDAARDVVVPSGADCTLVAGSTAHNVTVRANGRLALRGVTLTGDLNAKQAVGISIEAGTRLHNAKISATTGNYYPAGTFGVPFAFNNFCNTQITNDASVTGSASDVNWTLGDRGSGPGGECLVSLLVGHNFEAGGNGGIIDFSDNSPASDTRGVLNDGSFHDNASVYLIGNDFGHDLTVANNGSVFMADNAVYHDANCKGGPITSGGGNGYTHKNTGCPAP